jgi:hypothetical protein
MDREDVKRNKTILWGVFLIALGSVFLLDRFGIVDVSGIGQLWPLVFVVIAISHLFERRPGSAVMFLLMSAAFLAVQFDWMGITYRNFWPLLLVAVGAGMVVKAISGEESRKPKGGQP